MGVSFSSLEDIRNNSHIERYLNESIPSEDPFWNQFCSFIFIPQYLKSEEQIIIENVSKFTVKDFINFKNLCDGIKLRCEEVKEYFSKDSAEKNSIFLKQLHNELFILRYSLKLIHFKKHINAFDDIYDSIYDIIIVLMSTVLDLKVKDINYFIHAETVMIINTILYTNILRCQTEVIPKLVNNSLFFEFTKYLLRNITEESLLSSVKLPQMGIEEQPYFSKSVLEYVSFGWYSSTVDPSTKLTILSTNSVFLILKMMMLKKDNPCKQFIYDMNNEIKENEDGEAKFPFNKIYSVIEKNFNNEYYMLLLYVLMYKNNHFRTYVLKQESFSSIILPILKRLYEHSNDDLNLVYMCLIFLLILSEDDNFNQRIHREIIKDMTWIKTKSFSPISLGSITVFVLCRLIQSNLHVKGDKYVQTNCLACLANMSSKFINLHGQSAEQMIIVVISLQKKRNVLIKSTKQKQEIKEDLQCIEETLQTILEIINTSLIFSLTNNPDMIHIFLYHRKLFTSLKELQSTKTFANNIESILSYFTSKMEKELGSNITSENEVLKIIKKYSSSINKFNNFKSFPELKYKYVEEESAEEFFIPYLLKLFTKESYLLTDLNDILGESDGNSLTCLA